VRGDDRLMRAWQCPTCGSPPRAWGRCVRQLAVCAGLRFTPTCVGTIPPYPARTDRPTVHPHVRGDDTKAGRTDYQDDGSPPRAWGRCHLSRRGKERDRFTPTCVGTILSRAPPAWPSAVHPHVRGDDEKGAPVGAPKTVHPHVRGDDVVSTGPGLLLPVHPHVRGDD